MAAHTISVALCTFNGSRYLRQQLASLGAQSRPPDELVVCDDRSTDDTVTIVAEFAASAAFPVRVISNEMQLGYRSNFRKAAGLCRSDLIAFCDQDDVWLPSKLEACAKPFADPGVALVYHEAALCDAEGTPSGTLVYGKSGKSVTDRDAIDPWFSPLGFTEVFRAALLHVPGLESVLDHREGTDLAHDQLVFIAALAQGSIVFLKDVLVQYRQHGTNVFGTRGSDLKSKLLYLRLNRSRDYQNMARAAFSKARFIRDRLQDQGAAVPFISAEVARRYETLGKMYETRAGIFAGRGLFHRAGLYRRLSRANAYSLHDPWLIPMHNRIRDLVFGVILQPWLLAPPP